MFAAGEVSVAEAGEEDVSAIAQVSMDAFYGRPWPMAPDSPWVGESDSQPDTHTHTHTHTYRERERERERERDAQTEGLMETESEKDAGDAN